MIDGYEFLQGLSTQLPEMFQETAAQHRKTLQDAVASLGSEDQAILAANEEVCIVSFFAENTVSTQSYLSSLIHYRN